jgi:hypothetical protein
MTSSPSRSAFCFPACLPKSRCASRGPEITTRTKSRLALALIARLLPLVEHIAAYDKDITQLFLRHADSTIFESLPRAGKRLAPRLPGRNWG